jgi:hypothetical protein
MTAVTDAQKDLIEKWMLTVSLMGLTDVKELWDSDGETYQALDFMAQLEEHQSLVAAKDVAMLAAQRAQQMGVTTALLSQYSEYLQDLAIAAEQARLIEDEANNTTLNSLYNEHNFKIKQGPKATQIYWSFTGDVGHGGVFDYECRIVKISWSSMRVWLEWTDKGGMKRREKIMTSRYDYPLNDRWPEMWRQSSTTPGYSRVPYIFTRTRLVKEQERKAELERKQAKALERKQRRQQKQEVA